MNELFINDCLVYFKTDLKNPEDALDKLFEICNQNGIEMVVENYALRDQEGNDICY